MGLKISAKDLKKDMLSEHGKAMLSEFALIWHSRTGEVIDLDANDTIIRLFRTAERTNSRRLRSIYLHLRAELSNKIEHAIPQCDGMLIERFMSQVAGDNIAESMPGAKAA